MATKIRVSHEFVGFSDYWGGNGRRWDDDAGCLFAHYGKDTTLADIVDQWVDDYCMGGDCDSFPADIDGEDIRAAILDSLTDKGRADYDSGALAECAEDYARDAEPSVCRDCGAALGEPHEDGCSVLDGLFDDDDHNVTEDDCDDNDDMCESPVWIILVEVEVCSECGAADEHAVDDICAGCAEKHGYTV